jgi:hypothetical protein
MSSCGIGEGVREGPLETGRCCHNTVEGGFVGSCMGLVGCASFCEDCDCVAPVPFGVSADL